MKSNKNKIVYTFAAIYTLVICIATILILSICGKLTNLDSEKSSHKSNVKKEDETSKEGTVVEDDTEKDEDIVVEEKDDMTIIVYIIGSNLESDSGLATRDIGKFVNADMGDNVNIVVQAGGANIWNNDTMEDGCTHRFSIEGGKLNNFVNMGRVNMASHNTLATFIKDAVKEYPAEKYTLLLWNHGGNIPMQYGADDLFPGEEITYAELNSALDMANVHFDTIIFNACLMATLEVAISVMDYADYMVAAESVIWDGLDYTNWLESIKQNPFASPITHCDVLMKDYMAKLDQYELMGSISMLDLDKIDEVYREYVDYATEVAEELRNKGYEEYFLLRDGCGFYSNTDSVDIITLATLYETDESDDLINAVENAVVYSDSDYDYSNGLATYSPHQDIELYTEGRATMESIGYDEAILDYLDVYCSISLKYMGDDIVNQYAGAWYDVAAVDAQIEGSTGTNPGEYELATIEKNGQRVVRFSDEDFEIIKMITSVLAIQVSDEYYVAAGSETYLEFDQDGDLVVGLPDSWTTINGYIASIVLLDRYVDYETDEWEEISGILAKRNGKDILLITYYSSDLPDGKILGYMNCEYAEEPIFEDSSIYLFEPDDVINLIHPLIDYDGNVSYEQVIDENILASQLELVYQEIDLSDKTVISYISVEDIYGNTYETEALIYN